MKVIDGAKLREMIVGGAKNLENNKAIGIRSFSTGGK